MFSVLIATYNGSKYIIEQLESIVHQTLSPNSIYIYDDCSTDNTIEVVSKWIKRNNINNVFIKQNNENKGYTRNFLEALFEIEDEYILLCDQDDVWKYNKIEVYKNVIDNLEDKTLPILISSGYSITNEFLIPVRDIHCECKETDFCYVTAKQFLKHCSYPGMTFCINKTLRQKIEELFVVDKIAFHDYFISLTAIKYGKMICINNSLVLYRQHSNNQIGVAGKRDKNRVYWKKILNQKQLENDIASYVFSENKYIKSKKRFAEKRVINFISKRFIHIILSFGGYLRFYDFKSYLADIYYSTLGKE